jgi:uncharacterized protein YdaU (DUF1376 family)
MSDQPYMTLYVADFLGDTLHLSSGEIGQYVLLLLAMWRSGGSLPNDPKKLSRIARGRVSESVMAFFTVADERLTQKRLQTELEKAREKISKASLAGKASGAARALKNNDAGSTDVRSELEPQSNQPEPEPEPIRENKGASRSRSACLNAFIGTIDSERAEAIFDHRRAIKKALTVRAAELLAGKLKQCPNPNAAADLMIERGWTGIDPDWLKGKPPPRRNAMAEALERIGERARQHDTAINGKGELLGLSENGRGSSEVHESEGDDDSGVRGRAVDPFELSAKRQPN